MPLVNEGSGHMMGLLEVVNLWPSSVRLVPGTVPEDTPRANLLP